MLLNFEADAKSLRPRPKGPETKSEARARGYRAETETKILAFRPVWPRGFNISGSSALYTVLNRAAKRILYSRLLVNVIWRSVYIIVLMPSVLSTVVGSVPIIVHDYTHRSLRNHALKYYAFSRWRHG